MRADFDGQRVVIGGVELQGPSYVAVNVTNESRRGEQQVPPVCGEQ